MTRSVRGSSRSLVTGVVGIAIAIAGCGGEGAPADGAQPEGAPSAEASGQPGPTSPSEAFEAFEASLRSGGPPTRIAFDVTAEGAVAADLTGTLLLGDDGRARLEANGDFAGQALDMTLISDGERMFWTGSEGGADTPPALRDALGVGFTRMGVLHNLARLSGAAPPDHADGGVAEWVVVTPTDAAQVDIPEATDATSVFRDITVAGQPSGSYALEFDGPRPVVRRQVVEFPQGIMRVTERYRVVEFGADLPAGAFDTTPLDTSR